MARRPTRRSATSDSDAGTATLAQLVAREALDPELAALIVVLAEHGLPLTVASPELAGARQLRAAVTSHVLASNPSRDSIAGGVVIGTSLEDVLRILGGAVDTATGEMADESRDVGVVIVLGSTGPVGAAKVPGSDAPGRADVQRVRLAHYVRPVERDGAGHIQRRPPAVLSAWNADRNQLDHFYWAITDELATRVGIDRDELERAHAALARRLAGVESPLGPSDARH